MLGRRRALRRSVFTKGCHTFASILIAAGVNAKALSTYLGHSSIQIILDRYGHLMPGNEDEAVAFVDAYLERATILCQSATVVSGFQRSQADV
jgi:integrase